MKLNDDVPLFHEFCILLGVIVSYGVEFVVPGENKMRPQSRLLSQCIFSSVFLIISH